MTAMKIVWHRSEQMHRRYNQISADDLRDAAAQLALYQTKTKNDGLPLPAACT